MKKKRILLLVINGLLLLAFFACLIVSGSMENALVSQQAAKAFAGQSGLRFAQVSAFLPESAGLDAGSLAGIRSGLDAALVAASLEAPEGGSLYADAWSGQGSVDVSGARGQATAAAIGVGGDFFLFHPLYLRDGSYLGADDLMKDRVVLDEELAWRLFGSVDLAGLELTIGGKPYLIAGVVSREEDPASQRAYSGEAGIFMSYEALAELTEASISCYELVMADPITGFALQSLTDCFPVSQAVLVENSARFSLASRFKLLGDFGSRSMKTDSAVYPYWENAARYTEDWLALLLVLELLFLLCPLVSAVVFLVKLIRLLTRKGKRAARTRLEQREEREAEAYALAHGEELPPPDLEDIVREVLEEQAREKAEMQ